MQSRWWALSAVGLVIVATAGMADAQTGASLVITAPQPGTTSGPDLVVVVGVQGTVPSAIAFRLVLDGRAADMQDPATDRTLAAATVSLARAARVLVSGIPDGHHVLRAVPVSAGSIQPSAALRFVVAGRPVTLPFILIAVAGLGILLYYRRRILAPWADRYERRSPEDGSEEEG